MLIFTFQEKQEIEETKTAHEVVSNELTNLKKQDLEIIEERDRLRSEKKQLLDQEEISFYNQIIVASMLFLECQVI